MHARLLLGTSLFLACVTVAPVAKSVGTTRTYTGPSFFALRIDASVLDGVTNVTVIDTTTTKGTTSEASFSNLPAAGSPLLPWLTPWLAGTANSTKNVDLVRFDANYVVQDVETFAGTSITSFRFPELDAASTAAINWDVKLAPVPTQHAVDQTVTYPSSATTRKKLQANLFRLQIEGTDSSRVSKLGSILVTPRLSPGTSARSNKLSKVMPPTTTPLVFWVASTSATSFTQWLSTGAAPKNGSIAYLNPDMSVACTATLSNLVITTVATDTSSTTTPRSRVEATIGGIAFSCN